MLDRRRGPRGGLHDHPRDVPHASCLYEIALREAIAAQHGLRSADRLDLHACAGCGKPYLLGSVWQPISEAGEIACPRCGTVAVTWEGARGSIAYWQREGILAERRTEAAHRLGGPRRAVR